MRGFPEPRVAIDGGGKSAVVYSQGVDRGEDTAKLRLFVRAPGGRSNFFEPGLLPGQGDPDIAVNPSGAMAIAGIDDGRLDVTLYPGPGPKPSPPWGGPQATKVVVDQAGFTVGEPQVGIDGAGVATVVWASPPIPTSYTPVPVQSRVYAVRVTPPGVASPVQELGAAGPCLPPRLDVNLRGDAAVLVRCGSTPAQVFVAPAGGGFGAGETVPGFEWGPTDVTIDGAGEVLAIEAGDPSVNPKEPYNFRVSYSLRPPTGAFGAAVRLALVESSASQFEVESQEDGRTLAAWRAKEGIRYSARSAGGSFRPPNLIRLSGGQPNAMGMVAAPRGPGLIWWQEGVGRTQVGQFSVSVVPLEGVAGKPTPVGVPGSFSSTFAPSFAINEAGRAIGAWEQRCWGGAFAVMTVVRDARGGDPVEPPCQDTAAPKVAVRPKWARVVGRSLRVRVGCDEACRVGVRVRVLRGNRGRPLATGTLRTVSIPAARYRRLTVRLRPGQAAAVRRAFAAGSRVMVRLALPVRDAYENGTVRRIAVPLRR